MKHMTTMPGLRMAMSVVALATVSGCSSTVADTATTKPGDAAADRAISRRLDAGDADDGSGEYILPPSWKGGAPKVIGSGIEGVSVAVDGANVYWQGTGGAVYACPFAGCAGGKATILSALIGGSSDLQTLVAYNGVALFLTSQGDGISRVSYATPTQTSTTYSATGNGIGALVSDGANLYFTNNDAEDGGQAVALSSCPLQGACTSPVSLYQSTDATTYVQLDQIAVSGSEVFFIENADSTSLRAVSTSGGDARTVCTSDMLGGAVSLVVAGGYAYFTTQADASAIYQCSTSGVATASLFLRDYAPYALATDGTNLYWTNYVPTTGTVATCAVGAKCTAPLTVASMQDAPFAIAANATSVYWSTSTAIFGADR